MVSKMGDGEMVLGVWEERVRCWDWVQRMGGLYSRGRCSNSRRQGAEIEFLDYILYF